MKNEDEIIKELERDMAERFHPARNIGKSEKEIKHSNKIFKSQQTLDFLLGSKDVKTILKTFTYLAT